MKLHDKEFELFIDSTAIQNRVLEIATLINSDFRDKDPLFIGVLNGAFMFASDLFKHLEIPAEISFIKVSSYEKLTSTGDVKQLLGLDRPVIDREVIILEDIIDSGNTMVQLLKTITGLGAKNIEIASLLVKPDALKHKIDIKYIGFEIPNAFVVGYGMDFNGQGRNHSGLYQLKL